MFSSYWKMAIRSIAKNRLYAFINIMGLAIGLTIYLFGGMIAKYEQNHDVMFDNHERIYTIGSELTPNANLSVKSLDNTYSAVAWLLRDNLDASDEVTRTIKRMFLLSNGDKHFHERISFTDANFTKVFNLNYLRGNEEVLNDPNAMVLTESKAIQFFGSVDAAMGQQVQLNHETSFYIGAVIQDLPKNSHFNSSFIYSSTEILASLVALNRMAGWELEGNWYNISSGNQVYLMTKTPQSLPELNQKINTIFKAHAPEDVQQDFMSGLQARPLKQANMAIWDMIGMPVIDAVQVLGLFILIIAIVNYTNLATAQSMGRSKEVGLRKTLGANRGQLMVQFLFESITISVIATAIAIVLLELMVPFFNSALNKALVINHLEILPWVLLTAVIVGIVAGLYPSYLITKVSPTNALKGTTTSGKKGSLFRSFMIGAQFTLSIFMLSLVLIVLFQNQKVKDSAAIFPNDQVVVLDRTNVELIEQREDILRNELLKVPYISNVSFSSQVPFQQSNRTRSVSVIKGDVDSQVKMNIINVDHHYLSTFDIPIVAGRDFSKSVSADERTDRESLKANVIINELMSQRLGFATPQEAVGQTVWGMPGDTGPFQYNIIGVMADKNFLGLHNDMKSWLIAIHPGVHEFGAVRLEAGASAQTLAEIERIWTQVIPEYPIQHRYLSALFYDIYKMYQTMSAVLAGFASIALTLALIGLFGLAAFMARGRTKEIGIRKVLGASLSQIVKMILWQFSKPVMWAIIFAMPSAYFASNLYLQFFAERIQFQIPLIAIAGVLAVGLAWVVISVHALRVAKANPIKALRYE